MKSSLWLPVFKVPLALPLKLILTKFLSVLQRHPQLLMILKMGTPLDWVFFGGNNAGGGGGALSDRPQEGSFYFSTGWGGEGTASGFYGGTFKNFDNLAQVTLPADPVFNIWVLEPEATPRLMNTG
ncbi:MAG: hypothetical protein R3D55_24265 [Chloroflexota bacterium]